MSDPGLLDAGAARNPFNVVPVAPDTRPVQATTDSLAPAPSFSQLYSAARPIALHDTVGPAYEDATIYEGYAKLLPSLGLPDSENPGYFANVDPAGQARFGDGGAPSILATQAGVGAQVPFARTRMADRALQESLIIEQLKAHRAKDPNFAPGYPDTVEGLHAFFGQQQAAERQAGAAVLARGSFLGRSAAGLGAGLSVADPVQLAPQLIMGGTASSLVQAAGRDALINGVLSATQTALNIAEGREHPGGFGAGAEDVLTSGLEGAAIGAGLGAVAHVAVTHVPPALFKIMPESVQTRWAGRMRVGEGKDAPLLKDVLADMDNRELATFSRSAIGDKMTPDEKGAADTLERSQEIGEASPFTPGPAGDAAHNASLADAMKRLIDGEPQGGTRAGLLGSSSAVSLRPPAPVALPEDAGFGAQWAAIKRNEHGIAANGEFLVSPKGALGPAQVMPGTAPYAAKLAGLPWDDARYRADAAYNEALGRAYYAEQLKTFGDPDMAAAAYNAGPGSAARGTGLRGALRKAAEHGEPENWEAFLPRETQRYVEDFRKRTGRAPGQAAPVDAAAGGDEGAIEALRQSADQAETDAIGLSRDRELADNALDRDAGGDRADPADVPVLKRELFPDDQSWADAQASFHQSLNAPEAPAGRPLSGEATAAAAAHPETAEAAAGATEKSTGPFGPELTQAAGDWRAALAALREAKTGVVPGALDHPEIGPIDLPYGRPDTKPGAKDGFGLAHILADHPEIGVAELPDLIAAMRIKSRSANRIILEGPDHKGAVSLDRFGEAANPWLLTAYAKKPSALSKVAPSLADEFKGSAPRAPVYPRDAAGGRDGSPDRGATADISDAGPIDNVALKAFEEPGGAGAKEQVASLEHDARMAVEARNASAAASVIDRLTRTGKLPRAPMTLIEFLAKRGGLKDVGGDLAKMGAAPLRGVAKRGQRKLISPRGAEFDDAFAAAIDAGYFPQLNGLRRSGGKIAYADLADESLFLEAIDEELRGNPTYSDTDQHAVFERARAAENDASVASHVDDLQSLADTWGIAVDEGMLEHALSDVGRGADSAEALENAVQAAAMRDLGQAVADTGNLQYGLDSDGRPWDDEVNYAEHREAAADDRAPRPGERRPAAEAANPAAGGALARQPEGAAGAPGELGARRYQLDETGEPKTLSEILDEIERDRAAAAALRACGGGDG